MKKVFTMVIMATLLVAGSASAQWGRHLVAQPNATFAAGSGIYGGLANGPSTTNNDDSCDIGITPAATLLLPYFEVDTSARGTTTIFQVTNTSRYPQVAHVTLWTDWSYPVLDFNIFLTGYDVAPINLYDVIVNGFINTGSSPITAASPGKVYQQSPPNFQGAPTAQAPQPTSYALSGETGNPNFAAGGANCTSLPGTFNSDIQKAVLNALVNGVYNSTNFSPTSNPSGGCASDKTVGSGAGHNGTTNTTTAIGYVTMDVASVCSTKLPIDEKYFAQEILFDNVLTGDFEIYNAASGNNYAGGEPLVHIRAIPEGGVAGSAFPLPNATNLPYTFYSRYVNGASVGGVPLTLNMDRRQPLPSVFAARYIYNPPPGVAGNNPLLPAMNTSYRIWREGVTGNGTGNATFPPTACGVVSANAALPITEIVRFDERENAVVISNVQGVSPNLTSNPSTLPETVNQSVSNYAFANPTIALPNGTAEPSVFPQMPLGIGGSNDAGGWMYLNLDSGKIPTNATSVNQTLHPLFGVTGTALRASQNWVIVSESATAPGLAAGAYAADFSATWLGNGCSGAVGKTTINSGVVVLGPVGGAVTGFTNVTP
jgi:hypothetical protein